MKGGWFFEGLFWMLACGILACRMYDFFIRETEQAKTRILSDMYNVKLPCFSGDCFIRYEFRISSP